jgi:hypothetical protein
MSCYPKSVFLFILANVCDEAAGEPILVIPLRCRRTIPRKRSIWMRWPDFVKLAKSASVMFSVVGPRCFRGRERRHQEPKTQQNHRHRTMVCVCTSQAPQPDAPTTPAIELPQVAGSVFTIAVFGIRNVSRQAIRARYLFWWRIFAILFRENACGKRDRSLRLARAATGRVSETDDVRIRPIRL